MDKRVKGRRLWIKLYPVDCLDGSIRYQLQADERGVWYDLLNFSAICANPGTIADKDGRPYPHSFIANRLNISLELLEQALKKCKEEGRIREDDGGEERYADDYYQQLYECKAFLHFHHLLTHRISRRDARWCCIRRRSYPRPISNPKHHRDARYTSRATRQPSRQAKCLGTVGQSAASQYRLLAVVDQLSRDIHHLHHRRFGSDSNRHHPH